MAWAETAFLLQHFYNAFDIDNRVTELEFKSPFIAKNIDGKPEGIEIEDLSPGIFWFIKDEEENQEPRIKGLSILGEDGEFSEPILLDINLKNMHIEDEEITEILNDLDLTADNYYEVIKSILEQLKSASSIEVKPNSEEDLNYTLFIT